ncbi:sodium:solute symporter family protein [Paraburkholderia rhynchosiae]|uniref:Monocarboxylate transport permease protein n=1 Tax=Paraburkholderia rhynchosiae TaxID=487049 RepID=A0A2N7VZ81_9BURK|nr:sodium:solute symporter family protein [Paraburkholderia rhynchosiae]PMS22433.1 sodium:solute symporter [Paraburkholderia rhynchosiae]CAB3738066.1 Monocarboxylate transport permease protein [Paraburkholderia rhynchosiae]
MATAVFLGFIAFSLYLAVRSKQGRGPQSVHDFFVASRQFGAYLVFFLAAGEIYSIGTMVGFPGGIYAKGPTYGVWFLGYILLAYPVGYFIGPKIWQAGKRYNAITLPDLFKGHFQSRSLELIVAGSAILFLLPWGQLQFTGLVAALNGLGWHFKPLYLILISALLAFTYIAIAGVRASAYIAVLKDILMVAAIVVTGVAVSMEVGVTDVFHAASLHVSNRMNPHQLTFSMSTMLFQSLGFYVMPFAVQNFFTAKSANTIRRTQVAMPLYMLMYPFLVVASYYAISQNLHLASPNEAFFAAAVRLLPGWLLGLVAAGASLSGLLVLAGICLAIGPIVTRNLLPNLPETRQKKSAKMVIVLYLLISIVMTLLTPNLMLTLINTTYYGVTQFFPGVMIILFGLRVRPAAIAAGMLTGQILAIILYVLQIDLGGFNLGLLCLGVNLLVLTAVNLTAKPSRAHALS